MTHKVHAAREGFLDVQGLSLEQPFLMCPSRAGLWSQIGDGIGAFKGGCRRS